MLFRKKRKSLRRKPKTDAPKVVLLKQALIGLFLILLFVGLGYGVWHGSRVASLTITEVTVLGGETVSHDDIRAIATKHLEGEYFRLVPHRFAWLYPEDAIQSEVVVIDRIKNAFIERVSGTEIIIVFEEYRPIALWCKQRESKECLFLDSDGYAFATAPWLEGAAFMRYSDRGRGPTLKLQAFPGDFIEETNVFIENTYDQLGLNIIHVELTAKDELAYHISGGGVIKVTTRMSTLETLENLETILNSQEFAHLEPGNFKYIDLRYGNKIFVNEELDEPEKENATSTELVAEEGDV